MVPYNTNTNARLCGQASGHSNHPRLEVKMTFAMPGGRKEFKVKDAVADAGGEITFSKLASSN